MEKSLAIANRMIQLAMQHQRPPTQMKLQKLIFYAHGWHLALFDAPLVDETFEAWRYGPVLPTVYHEFKNFGLMPIDREGTEPILHNSSIHWIAPQLRDATGNTDALLRKIWEVFGGYSGTELSDMTHAPGTPWYKARKAYGESERHIPIENREIQRYFKEIALSNA